MKVSIEISTHLQALLTAHCENHNQKLKILEMLNDDELTPFGKIELIAAYNELERNNSLTCRSIADALYSSVFDDFMK